jgi:hypothetical protein
MRTSFLFGAMNVIVALIAIHLLRAEIAYLRLLRGSAYLILLALGAGFFASERLMAMAETATYEDPVIFATSSSYQRIVLSKRGRDLRLHLNGNLQFSSRDEYRYHEAFIHPALSTKANARRVLVLGGGDGMAVREILKYPQIESIVLVDLDPAMTRLFSTEPILLKLNDSALHFFPPTFALLTKTPSRGLSQIRNSSTLSPLIFPTPQTSLSANSTRRLSIASCATRWILMAFSLSNPHPRTSHENHFGASIAP